MNARDHAKLTNRIVAHLLSLRAGEDERRQGAGDSRRAMETSSSVNRRVNYP